MTTVFNIITLNNELDVVTFPNEYPHSRLLDIKNKGSIQFGQSNRLVSYKTDSGLKENEIGISANIIESLKLPVSLSYEIRINPDQNTIVIGPYIGILAAKTNVKLNRKLLNLKKYLQNYNVINGCVLVFSLEGLNLKTKMIDGFIYKPDTDTWERGLFLFPTTILRRRTSLTKDLRSQLETTFGSRFINNKNFNKWEMYQWLSKNSGLRDHLPSTILYQQQDDLLNFINTYKTIYMKPLLGMMGKKIITVRKTEEHYEVNHSKGKKLVLKSENDFLNYCKRTLIPKKYILQQALNLSIIKNHMVDFRIIIIKNQVGNWEYIGALGRCGTPKGIVSNYAAGGKVYPPLPIIQDAFNLTEEEAMILESNMAAIALNAAQELEKQGVHIYKFGVDIAIDVNKQLWLIEMNHRYLGDSVFKLIGDSSKGETLRMNTILYAKYVAGFEKEND